MQDFRDLKVWRMSHELALEIYRATRSFPKEELYGLTSQIRRSAVSVPSNIAEGTGRGTDADFGRFLQIAMGSACELEYQLVLASDLQFLKSEDCSRLLEKMTEVKRMLTSLIQKTRENAPYMVRELEGVSTTGRPNLDREGYSEQADS